MSVIGEIAAVAGVGACVAAIVSAYRDGDGIIQRIKVKRAEKRATPPPSSLERSITAAPRDIEAEKRRGVDRFGPAFDRGDDIAVYAMQYITIQVQGNLLKRLYDATLDPDMADFRGLSDVADSGRDNTIATLIALQQRLSQAAPIIEMSALRLESSGQPQAYSSTSRANGMPPQSITAPPQLQNPFPEPSNTSRPAYAVDSTQRPRSHRPHFAIFGRREQRSTSIPAPQSTTAHRNSDQIQGPPRVFTLPADMPNTEQRTSSERRAASNNASSNQAPAFTYQPWEDNPSEIWGSNRLSTYVPPSNAAPTPTRSRSDRSDPVDSPMRLSIASGSSSAGTTPALSIHRTSTTSSAPHPSAENDFLGFCKGAWKLQNGERKKAFTTSTDPSSMYGGLKYLSCRKCKFECHYNVETIWNQVWLYESLGIKLRWPFLAKSHVPQKTTLDRQAIKQNMLCYKCIFCAFEGLGAQAPVIHGLKTYLLHISQIHRGSMMSDVVTYQTHCINDRICADTEKFDINLFPLTSGRVTEVVELG